MSGTPDGASPGGRGGLTLVEVAIILVILWVTAEFVFAALPAARERNRRRYCCSNLKSFGYALHLYSGDCREHFPPTLGVLYPAYISDGEVFLCPSAGRATALEDDPRFSLDRQWHVKDYTPAMFGDTHTDYVYVAGLMASDPSDYVLAFEDEWNHDGEGAYVLHVGGQVVWLSELKALHGRLAKQEKDLAAQGREMKLLRPAWSRYPELPPARPWYPSLGWRAAALGALIAIVAALALVVRKLKPDGSGARHDDTSDGRPAAGGEGSEART